MALDPWPPNITSPVGKRRVEAQTLLFSLAIDGKGLVKAWVNDHSAGLVNPFRGNPQHPCLLRRSLGAAYEELLLRFDPEVGRIVREIGENCDEGNRVSHAPQALQEGPIEMRDK